MKEDEEEKKSTNGNYIRKKFKFNSYLLDDNL